MAHSFCLLAPASAFLVPETLALALGLCFSIVNVIRQCCLSRHQLKGPARGLPWACQKHFVNTSDLRVHLRDHAIYLLALLSQLFPKLLKIITHLAESRDCLVGIATCLLIRPGTPATGLSRILAVSLPKILTRFALGAIFGLCAPRITFTASRRTVASIPLAVSAISSLQLLDIAKGLNGRIRLPEGAARKVFASVRRTHIPETCAASGPNQEPGRIPIPGPGPGLAAPR